jgi:NAD(P)-dependent dehydrogenase (short-subunit alcohol dehydrogenase family)
MSTTSALVTSAGRPKGIGFEVAAQLASQGMQVILTARDFTAAQARTQELVARGFKVKAKQLDITVESAVARLAQDIEQEDGQLDVLVNNAAAMAPYGERAATADLKLARDVIEATVFGTWRLTQALLPLLRKSAHPRIVNISSGAGFHGDPAFGLNTGNAMGTIYAVAKAALNALTVKLANEEKANGLLLNAVCPGFTATFEGGEPMGARPVKDGAASVAWAVLLPDDGPTGGFFRDGKPLPW